MRPTVQHLTQGPVILNRFLLPAPGISDFDGTAEQMGANELPPRHIASVVFQRRAFVGCEPDRERSYRKRLGGPLCGDAGRVR